VTLVLETFFARGNVATAGGCLASQVDVKASGAEQAPDMADVQSHETYVGSERAENFVSPGGEVAGQHRYSAGDPDHNQWRLAGLWTVLPEYAESDAADGGIVYHFHARDLHLVLGPRDGQVGEFAFPEPSRNIRRKHARTA